MKKLRWVTDGGFREVDLSTPLTVDGVARAAPEYPHPLGTSRGSKLSRSRQVDFLQRFMALPFVPSFCNTLSFQRIVSLPLPACLRDVWFAAFHGQFNVQKLFSSLRKSDTISKEGQDTSPFHNFSRSLSDKGLYALSFCSEWLLTPEDLLLLSLESRGDGVTPRKKAVFHHKFQKHSLTLEAASPALFVDHLGNYWDVPLTLSMDLASANSSSGPRYGFHVSHTSGSPELSEGQPASTVPPSLLPGLSAKCDISFMKCFEIWRNEASKKKMVQPYDILLSNPHVSASAVVGSMVSASLRDNPVRASTEDSPFGFRATGENSSLLADLYASVSFSAQHGNFQKQFLDLTRFNSRIDVPSGSKFLSAAYRVAVDLLNSRIPELEAVQALCPSASVSFQQQIAGPFSFRVDAEVTVDPKRDLILNVNDPVLAVEYALQVLGSAKAVAWYSLKQREFMVELRFFEA